MLFRRTPRESRTGKPQGVSLTLRPPLPARAPFLMQAAHPAAICTLLSLCACQTTDEAAPIEFERLVAGQIGLGPEAKNAVVRSFVEWQVFCGDQDQGLWGAALDVDWS